PYLVVAADKGTATFSDIANAVAAEYGFWLGDAFASGGSAGYDHKKMAITARGAWESVKRHFRELGVNTQASDFTVAGIGDMSGDVFGNGMLLSRHIKLVAAFDHRHVFLDPAPDAEKSFKERERLFNLPRSSWADYNAKLISKGGDLGFTQLGRIEFALAGGRINTDAIDNSAGVSCSDHEVNIKILLNAPVREGKLTYEQRNKLLADMTDEVAALVLRDNYFQ